MKFGKIRKQPVKTGLSKNAKQENTKDPSVKNLWDQF